MAQLAEGTGLELAHALTCDAELDTDLLERHRIATLETEAQQEDTP